MRNEFDASRLAAMIRTRRGSMSLREASAQIGEQHGDVSPSTLSRIETGSGSPDLFTLLVLCDWLKVEAATFFRTDETPATATGAEIVKQIRSDASLQPVARNVLSVLASAAYDLYPQEKANV